MIIINFFFICICYLNLGIKNFEILNIYLVYGK